MSYVANDTERVKLKKLLKSCQKATAQQVYEKSDIKTIEEIINYADKYIE